MPDPTAAARARRYRERMAGRLAPVERLNCSACSGHHTGAHGGLCRACWIRLTPDGRADLAARQQRWRERQAGLQRTVTGPATNNP